MSRVFCSLLLAIVLVGLLQPAEMKIWRHRQRHRLEDSPPIDLPEPDSDEVVEQRPSEVVPLPMGGEGRFGRPQSGCPLGQRKDAGGICRPIWNDW